MPSIDIGVIQQFLHPPIGFQGLTPLPGNPYAAGTYVFDRPSGPVGVDAFGMAWSADAIPSHIGRTDGFLLTYHVALAQIVVVHRMADGTDVSTQIEPIKVDGGLIQFSVAAPHFVGAYVLPGVQMNFFWSVVHL